MKELFKKWNFLIVSSQITQRSGLRKLLIDLGAQYQSIDVAGNLNQVEERFAKGVVNVIITDDEIESQPVADKILDMHLKNNPDNRERFFLLMINNPTPFLMADFSLKGGDAIINKPFRNETMVSTLNNHLNDREKATEDEVLFHKLTDSLNLSELDQAKQIVESFKDKESFFGTFSQGLIHEAAMEIEVAYLHFKNAFERKTDFRLLVKIIKLGVELRLHKELAPYVEKWIAEFPLHHLSIPDITRVIIVNERFSLLDDIFDCFSRYRITDQFAKIPIAAGFVMAAVHYVKNGEIKKAKVYATKGIEYACNKKEILFRAMEVLVQVGPMIEVEKTYMKLELAQTEVVDKVFDIKMKDLIYPKDRVLKDCLKLLSDKILHPELFRVTIDCMKQLGRDPQDVIFQARQAFPQLNWHELAKVS